ncbi:hypothetical protein DE146DRAFT_294103 [Phaeosphaeria sp. MPI-PUGE-AT-0046c]|nr:hypothetical protein DE146DRAFT_294103 [Phaeosphaeria sp. MPI-PUGE-AT-0046c]
MSIFIAIAMIHLSTLCTVSAIAIPVSYAHSSAPTPPSWDTQHATSVNAWPGAEVKDKATKTGADKEPIVVAIEVRESKQKTVARRVKQLPNIKTTPAPGMQCVIM